MNLREDEKIIQIMPPGRWDFAQGDHMIGWGLTDAGRVVPIGLVHVAVPEDAQEVLGGAEWFYHGEDCSWHPIVYLGD
jgi:hypothetical protein